MSTDQPPGTNTVAAETSTPGPAATPPEVLGASLRLPCGSVLPNRLAKAAMTEQLATLGGEPTERMVQLYRRWGRGGAGLLITGNIMIDRRALGEPRNVVIEDRRHLDALRRWTAAATAGGGQVWAQLNHPGRQTPRTLSRRPVAPSAVPLSGGVLRSGFATPRALTGAEIHEIVERFAAAAKVAVEAGFTGVQIHAAHGYLVSQFLSPLVNRRTDEWGGDSERRMRFLLRIVRAVRVALGAEVPIGVKLNSADFQRGGFDESESMAVVSALGEAGVDLLEVSGGTYEGLAMAGYDNRPVTESTRSREAYFLSYAEKVREFSPVPLMLTGGLRTAGGMAEAITGGAVDVIGLARPLALQEQLAARLLDGTAVASAIPAVFTGSSGGTAARESLWYTGQIWRLADGKDPDADTPMLAGLLRYAGATTRDVALRTLGRGAGRG